MQDCTKEFNNLNISKSDKKIIMDAIGAGNAPSEHLIEFLGRHTVKSINTSPVSLSMLFHAGANILETSFPNAADISYLMLLMGYDKGESIFPNLIPELFKHMSALDVMKNMDDDLANKLKGYAEECGEEINDKWFLSDLYEWLGQISADEMSGYQGDYKDDYDTVFGTMSAILDTIKKGGGIVAYYNNQLQMYFFDYYFITEAEQTQNTVVSTNMGGSLFNDSTGTSSNTKLEGPDENHVFKSAMKAFRDLKIDDTERDAIIKALAGDDPTENLVEYFSVSHHKLSDFNIAGLSYKDIFHLGSTLMKQTVPDPKIITLLMLIKGYMEEESAFEYIPSELTAIELDKVIKYMPKKMLKEIQQVMEGNDDTENLDGISTTDFMFEYIGVISDNHNGTNTKYTDFYDDYDTVLSAVTALVTAAKNESNASEIFDGVKDSFHEMVFATSEKEKRAHYNDNYMSNIRKGATGKFINDHIQLKPGGRVAVGGGCNKLDELGPDYMLFSEEATTPRGKISNDIYSKIHAGTENVVEIEKNTTYHGLDYRSYKIGDDAEAPMCIFVYWDGKTYRAYVPIRGNSVNTINKAAFGRNMEADIEYLFKYGYIKDKNIDSYPFSMVEFNYNECLNDFESRVAIHGAMSAPVNQEDHDTEDTADVNTADNQTTDANDAEFNIEYGYINKFDLVNKYYDASEAEEEIEKNGEYRLKQTLYLFIFSDEPEETISEIVKDAFTMSCVCFYSAQLSMMFGCKVYRFISAGMTPEMAEHVIKPVEDVKMTKVEVEDKIKW